MNKSQLISKIASNNGLTESAAKKIVDDVFTQIQETVSNSGKVQIHGFGSFTQSERKARVGRNPQTGAPIEISAKTVVKFKAHF